MSIDNQRPVPRPHFAGDGQPEQAENLAQAIDRTRQWLLVRQHADGHWCAELEGDTILESEYILLLAWLGREDAPLARKCARYIVDKQLEGGGWAMYPGGLLDVSGSVKAYFALKLTGHDPQAEYMRRAAKAIRECGGADAVNSFTRFYLALLGQISYDQCPAVPPEMMQLPNWFPLNIYRMSAWSRTIVVPLSIMWAHRPARQLPVDRGIGELFLQQPQEWPPLRCPGLGKERGWFSWEWFFRRTDAVLKWLEARRIVPLRKRSLAAAAQWMLSRCEHSDGLGAIFPPIIWSVIALKCLGYDDDSPQVRECFEQLDGLVLEDDYAARLQPCLSPVWDTAIALRSLAVSGSQLVDPPAMKAVDWLLDKEVTREGDWAERVDVAPGGWFFEYRNEFYPDVDDSVMVMIAMRESVGEGSGEREQRSESREQKSLAPSLQSQAPLTESGEIESPAFSRRRWLFGACDRARRWVLAMQNRDGGWGAFDKDNDAEFLCRVPFADHNAMIDPSTPDLTGRTLEALALWGGRLGQPHVDRAVAFLRQTQELDGSWYGRWGVNYIYGTWQALVGLTAVGVPVKDPMIAAGANWLLAHQQSCGGWGESADSYTWPELRGRGPVTASQTAWALLGLMAAGLGDHPATQRGIRWLLDTQQPEGSWHETEFTGTGFPRVFYLRYHYYPIYFPLLALSEYQRRTTRSQGLLGSASSRSSASPNRSGAS
ncbi:MAG TPA: terpene cyclase/mutase family protein [Pirellulaceae bacterium]|nr:terpene cyclase/mutase family protein [Pirellulaceae bacterium]